MYNPFCFVIILIIYTILALLQALSGQICPKYALKKQVKSTIYKIVKDLNEFVVKIQLEFTEKLKEKIIYWVEKIYSQILNLLNL